MELCEALKQLQKEMPPILAGTELDRYTGGGYRWRSLQNQKCSGLAPDNIFLRSGGRKLLIHRDRFLEFWQSKISKG